jgi:Integrase core domain
VATLAGRLSFFDLSDSMGARSYYNLALESAREAGDHHQAAAVLGHVAFIPAADRGFTAALDYLRGAEQHLTRHSHGPLSSWLAAVESGISNQRRSPHRSARRDRPRPRSPGPARSIRARGRLFSKERGGGMTTATERLTVTKSITATVGLDEDANALAENLWSTIKIELVYWPGTTFATRAEAEHAPLRYIDGWYNPRRIQAGLGGLSPDEYEDAYHRAQAAPDR